MDECDAKATDEDGFRPSQRSWIRRVASDSGCQPLHPDTGALLRSRGAQFYISNSTCVMSRMECSHPGGLEEFSGVITVAKKIESTTQSVLGFCLHSSANKDVVHDAFVAGLVGRASPA